MSLSIKKIKSQNEKKWMALPGVLAVGIGELKSKPCIRVLVQEKTKELDQNIPHYIEGIPIVIEKISEIRAFPGKGNHR